jgi:hypothetical protein
MTCRHDDDLSHVYRRIASWDAREERAFDADPVEPPEWWGTDPDLWEKTRLRRKHTSAIWTVTLTCGHRQHVHTSLTYDPATSKPQLVTLKRQREMQADCEAYEPANDRQEQLNHEHHLRMIAERWPRPMPEHECYLCPHVRRMVAIEPRGPLIKPEPQPTREERGAKRRASIERRLAQAQRDVERFRNELKELGE